jgi:hypothetical protein
LFVAALDPARINGTSRICPTTVPAAIAEIVAQTPSPNVIPTQPKAAAPRPTDVPTKITKKVRGVEVRSSSGMRSTPFGSTPLRHAAPVSPVVEPGRSAPMSLPPGFLGVDRPASIDELRTQLGVTLSGVRVHAQWARHRCRLRAPARSTRAQ